MACQVELFQQFLRRRYFVGLFVDFDMRKHECRVDSKRAEHLFRLGVVEAIKTAFERLTVKGDNSPARNCRIKVQIGRMFAKGLFNIRRRQSLQNIPDGGMSGRPFPVDLEGLVELWPMNLDEGSNAAIRVGSAYNRQNGKQQYVRQLIELAFSASWIADPRELREEAFE